MTMKILTDSHCHLAALPTKTNGCLMSNRMKNGIVGRSVARRLGLPMDDPEEANRRYRAKLSASLEASAFVKQAVVLAMDGVYGPDGRLDELHTDFLISNDYVLSLAAENKSFLAGVSVNGGLRTLCVAAFSP